MSLLLKRILFSIIFIFAILLKVLPADYNFRTFSPEGGFYYDGVKMIKQDSNKFIWIMLANDLLRFDGYNYASYYSHFQQINKDNKWRFMTMDVDSHGNLYVSTNHGTYALNSHSNKFEKIFNNDIVLISIDKKDGLWYEKPDSGLIVSKLDDRYQSKKQIKYDHQQLNNIVSLFEKENGMYIAQQYENVYFYDIITDKSKQIISLKDIQIKQVVSDDKFLWVLSVENGLFRVNLDSYETKHYVLGRSYENKYNRAIQIDKTGKIWIGTLKGLFIFDPEKEQYDYYLHSRNNPFSLPDNSIWTIQEDSKQNIWIGTFSGGLCYVNLDEGIPFKSLTPATTKLNNYLISGIAESNDYLWLATEGGGVNKVSKKDGTVSYLIDDAERNHFLSSSHTHNLIFDNNDNLWVPTFRGGLDCFDRNGNFTNISTKDGLYANNLRKIALQNNSGIWISYQISLPVLSFLSFKTNEITHYNLDKNENDDYILDIFNDSISGKIWLITTKKLYNFDVYTKTATTVNTDYSLNGLSVWTDSDAVWIGTVGKGLIKYSLKEKKFEVFDNILKYNASSIYSVLKKDNKVWLGTNNGLFVFDEINKKFSHYNKYDGIQGQVFFPLASFAGRNNRIYFGGTNGLTIINTEDIRQNSIKPNVILTNIFINNKSILFDTDESNNVTKNNLSLKHNQNNVGFEFSSDNYLMPQKNRFKYRLKGFEKDWIEVGASSRVVQYPKLRAGNYQFEVLTANNDGLWGDTPLTYDFKIKRHPLLSWWAIILYSCLFIGIVSLLFYYYNRQKSLKYSLSIKEIEREKQTEIQKAQLKFLTNISHDLKTPLSLIMAAVDSLQVKGLSDYYYEILKNNSQHLLNLINELMFVKQVSNKEFKLHIASKNVNSICTNIYNNFRDYAKKADINFRLELAEDLPEELYVAQKEIERIIINLLNNSFRFSKSGDTIEIKTITDATEYKPLYPDSIKYGMNNVSNPFCIVVSDTGVGISLKYLTKIFDRFYKIENIENKNQGSGLGLSIVQDLVAFHKGYLIISSKKNTGTEIAVFLSKEYDFEEKSHTSSTENDIVEDTQTETFSFETAYDVLPEKQPQDEKKQILVIEDNNDLRKLIVDYLSDSFEIFEADNGISAINLLEKIDFDIVVSDIIMPKMDGIAFCRKLKNNIDFSHIPIILLTAKSGDESKIEGADAGADVYLEKPVNLQLLLSNINKIFKNQKQLKEYYAKNFFADYTEIATNKGDKEFMNELIQIIEDNLDNSEFTVNDLSAGMLMSRSKLYTKIKSLTDKSIVEFVLNYKMKKAAKMIAENELSVIEIMDNIGIESQSYFTKAFKKEFGVTPTQFTQNYNKKNKTK